MSVQVQTKKNQMLESLRANLGNVTASSIQTGISRESHYHYLKTDPEYKEQVDEIQNQVFDFVESCLYSQIAKGDTQAISLFIRYSPAAKRRGWGPNLDITSGGNAISIPQVIVSIIPPIENPDDQYGN